MNNNPDNETGSLEGAEREWLVTNGLGGYASGTVSGRITRRFHGLLIAALPAPRGRTMMLNKLGEVVRSGDSTFRLSTPSGLDTSPVGRLPIATLTEFRLDEGLPVWTYEFGGARIERRLLLVHAQNTTYVTYKVLAAPGKVELELDPWLNFRHHEGPVDVPADGPYALTIEGSRFSIQGPGDFPPLRLRVDGTKASFLMENDRTKQVHYAIEDSRGYDAAGVLYSVGFFRIGLEPGGTASLVASTEPWEATEPLSPAQSVQCEALRRSRLFTEAMPAARQGLGRHLVLAADQFMITPAGRVADAAMARASGDEVRTVIAGYPWFTDWGRDTMISLEGLALVTGRHRDASFILRTFAHFVRDGLVPNMFPEGRNGGLYHTADATLWFFHAIDRYLAHTGDDATLDYLLPTLLDIADHHERGTLFGIGVDPGDGLLRQGAPGYQLTWMDAKVGDLVVTPRRGKAVEINALYYNALRLLERWTRAKLPNRADGFARAAERLASSFNTRFWNEAGGYLYDVVDREGGGNDPSFRPNQLFALSLPNPVLDPSRWRTVLSKVEQKLLTPVGLRTLSPDDPDYKPKYFGDLRARDLAYHQGTVWAWLMGPFVDAWLRVHPGEEKTAAGFLEGFAAPVQKGCVGTIAEIFDATPPFLARGCVAQAWSVAEVLRAQVRVAGALPARAE
jgi:predicted glycogen debranching enzyme